MSKKTIRPNQTKGRTAPGAKPRLDPDNFISDGAQFPSMHVGHKWDHGLGPAVKSNFNRTVAKTGPSQNPRQTYLGKNGVATGTANK